MENLDTKNKVGSCDKEKNDGKESGAESIIPDNFFDDFSNKEFMDGLNVLDSWDESVDENKEKRSDKRSPVHKRIRHRSRSRSLERHRSRSFERRHSRSFERRRSYRYIRSPSPHFIKRYRYNSPPDRRRRSSNRERSSPPRYRRRRRSSSPPPRRREEGNDGGRSQQRRDPEKNRADVQRDKDKCQRYQEAKDVEKKVLMAESGLCPPGMEDIMDELDAFKALVPPPPPNLKENDKKSSDKEVGPRQGNSKHRSTSNSSEKWFSNRSRKRSISPLRTQPVRKRSPFINEIVRTLCSKKNNESTTYNNVQYNQSPLPTHTNFNLYQQPPPSFVSNQIPVHQPILVQSSQPSTSIGYSNETPISNASMQVDQYLYSNSFQQQPPPSIVEVPPTTSTVDTNSILENLAPLKALANKKQLRSNLKDISIDKSSPRQISKLFEEKKISLSDFLAVSVKGDLPSKTSKSLNTTNLQDKIKVIARCQDAIKYLDKRNRLSGRFQPRLLCGLDNSTGLPLSSSGVKWRSPLKRSAIVKFNFTSANQNRSKETSVNRDVAIAMKRLLATVGLNPIIHTPVTPSIPQFVNVSQLSPDVQIISCTDSKEVQTDGPICQVCEIRRACKYRTNGSQTDPPNVSDVGIQVTQPTQPRSVNAATPSNVSLTHLTAAQLRQQSTSMSTTSPNIHNPWFQPSSMDVTNVSIPNEIINQIVASKNNPGPWKKTPWQTSNRYSPNRANMDQESQKMSNNNRNQFRNSRNKYN